FTATPISSHPGEFQFVSTSTGPSGQTLDQHWMVSDGSTAEGPGFSRTFATPGTYRVTLAVSDLQGDSDSTFQDVVVAAPTLATAVTVLASSTVPPGRVFDVDVTVSASADGVGDLTGLQFASGFEDGLAAQPADAASLVSGPTPGLPSTL